MRAFLLAAGAAALLTPVNGYPSASAVNKVPIANGGSWTKGFQKAKALVEKLTTEEKSSIVTSQVGRCAANSAEISRLGLPSLCYQDGPQGVRPATGQSQFPSEHTTAATWNRDLFYKKSYAMGQEFHDLGVHFPLAPVACGPLVSILRLVSILGNVSSIANIQSALI